jgi:hypothetical protein
MVERDDTPEVWLPIEGHPGYEVSDLGRVRSLTRTITVPDNRWGGSFSRTIIGRMLRQKIWTDKSIGCPYYKINLSQNSKNNSFSVHFLVCRAFHGPRPTPAHQVAHWDGDSLNNVATNLRWATPVENAADMLRHGKRYRGSRNANALLTESDVTDIRRALANGVPYADLAATYGVAVVTIKSIKHRRHWAWLP